MDSKSLISFKGIKKRFGSKLVINDLSLDIHRNEITTILGKSGCGKSTLFKILLGFYPPDRGNIFYEEKNLINNLTKIRSIVGFVSQENSFYEKLTVQENLYFFARLYKVNVKHINNRIKFLLDLVRLSNCEHLLVTRLSGGMRRRLEFAISLIHDPKILILDEPFTGLDIEIREELWRVLKKIKNSGVTILLSTHLLTSAQKNSDRILFLHREKIDEDIILTEEMKKGQGFNIEEKFLEVISR